MTNRPPQPTRPLQDDGAPATTQIRLLCDVAIRLALAIAQRLLGLPGPEGLRERGLLTTPPGTIVLPTLYRQAAEPPAKGAGGSGGVGA
jgi:hypothetical protein